jgi:hypothetical protein
MPATTAPWLPASCSKATIRRWASTPRPTVYENLVQAGVIDPTKVVRTALQDAASVAGLLITTEAAVSELPEDKPAMPMGRRRHGRHGRHGLLFIAPVHPPPAHAPRPDIRRFAFPPGGSPPAGTRSSRRPLGNSPAGSASAEASSFTRCS